MRISAVISALTFLGCDDLDSAGNKEPSKNANSETRISGPKTDDSKVGVDEIANGLAQLVGKSHLGQNNNPSSKTGIDSSAENRATKSHKNKGSLELESQINRERNQAGEEIVDKSTEKGPVSRDDQAEEKSNDEVRVKNGVDLAKAREIHEYMNALTYTGLMPDENIRRCRDTGSVVDIGSGGLRLRAAWSLDYWVRDESGPSFFARDMPTERDFRGYRLQEKLFSEMKDGVLEIRRPKYLDPGKEFCNKVMVFEDAEFYRPCANEYEPGVAARALEILKELHHLGIVHGRVGWSFKSHHEKNSQWTSADIDSLRLDDFNSAAFYVNTDTGELIPGKTPSLDLEAFAQTFLPYKDRPTFIEAISDRFDYDHWISHFRQLRAF